MSEQEQQGADWVASYDQVSSEAAQVMRDGHRFIMLWYDEETGGIGSTGIVREDDAPLFLQALATRIITQHGVLPAAPPPGFADAQE